MDYTALMQEHTDAALLKYLDSRMLTSINKFLKNLSERDEIVFRSRFGLGVESLTLEKTGEKVAEFNRGGKNMTRERVRQIQEVLITQWQEFCDVNASSLWKNTTQYYDLLNGDFLVSVAKLFDTPTDFNQFLTASSKRSPKDIAPIYRDEVKLTHLDDFWVASDLSPLPLQAAIDYIMEEEGVSVISARNVIFHMIAGGFIVVEEQSDLISPAKLNKAVAIAHACQAFEEGVSWFELQAYVNENGFCIRNMTEKRLDFAVGTAVDNGWIYQSNRGEYAPISLLAKRLGEGNINEVLEHIKALLEKQKEDSTPLTQLYNKNHNLFDKLDYYTVRYIAKQYGFFEGIFFSGLSGADMVSLQSDIEIKSKRDILVEEFSNGLAFTLNDVSALLRSGSRRHAVYLMDTLIKEGRIVKVERDTYVVASAVNGDLDIPKLMTLSYALLKAKKGERCLYKDLFSEIEGKSDLHLESAGHLGSLLRANHDSQKGTWTFSGGYVQLTA